MKKQESPGFSRGEEVNDTIALSDATQRMIAALRAGTAPTADDHIRARLERNDVFRANGVPEEDLPPIPDDLIRIASPEVAALARMAPADPDTIRAIRARKDRP